MPHEVALLFYAIWETQEMNFLRLGDLFSAFVSFFLLDCISILLSRAILTLAEKLPSGRELSPFFSGCLKQILIEALDKKTVFVVLLSL